MIQLHSHIPSQNLIQIDSDIHLEPEATEALSILINQFPDDYISKEQTKPKVAVVSEAEKAAKEKKDLIDYSALVAEDAADYQKEVMDNVKAKEESKHFKFLDEEGMLQLSSTVKTPANKKSDVNVADALNAKGLENNEMI